MEIKWSKGCLIYIMVFPMLVKLHFYTESGSWWCIGLVPPIMNPCLFSTKLHQCCLIVNLTLRTNWNSNQETTKINGMIEAFLKVWSARYQSFSSCLHVVKVNQQVVCVLNAIFRGRHLIFSLKTDQYNNFQGTCNNFNNTSRHEHNEWFLVNNISKYFSQE